MDELVGIREHDHTDQAAQVVAVDNELLAEVIERDGVPQLGVVGEIFECLHKAVAHQSDPYAVDEGAGEESISGA